MMPYWLLFLFPVLAVLSPVKGDAQVRALSFGIFAFIAITMIGLRYEVGGDWDAYQIYFDMLSGSHLIDVILIQDPGYVAINWLSAELGLGIAGVNLIGGALFIHGLSHFCRQQPYPWLGIAVTTPFLIIVVGMGYTRQAIAIGFVFLAMSVWSQKSFFKYVVLVFVASLFHKTAVIMLFFSLFINQRRLMAKLFFVLPVMTGISYALVVTSNFDAQYTAYILNNDYESHGGLIRVLMNIVPAVIVLLFYKSFAAFSDDRLWVMIAVLCLASFPLVFQYSMVIDRFALYLSPIQVAVYSRLPVFVNDRLWRTLLVTTILAMYAAVLFIWMNYAIHAEYWLPYQWILFQ